ARRARGGGALAAGGGGGGGGRGGRLGGGEGGGRWRLGVEVPFETLIAGRSVRGRIDAVFADSDGGGYDVVDWKTGQLPASDSDRQAAAVQLAAYPLPRGAAARGPPPQGRGGVLQARAGRDPRPAGPRAT